MFKNKNRALLAVFIVVLILTASIGGTIAYLAAQTGAVENVFTVPDTDITITDEVTGDVKENVVITNTSGYSVYIRAAIVATWRDESGNILNILWDETVGTFTGLSGANWVKHTDGFYYYTLPVAAGATTESALFTKYELPDELPSDVEGNQASYLQMDLLVQAVQAEPAQAIQDVWGVTISGGTVSAVTP